MFRLESRLTLGAKLLNQDLAVDSRNLIVQQLNNRDSLGGIMTNLVRHLVCGLIAITLVGCGGLRPLVEVRKDANKLAVNMRDHNNLVEVGVASLRDAQRNESKAGTASLRDVPTIKSKAKSPDSYPVEFNTSEAQLEDIQNRTCASARTKAENNMIVQIIGYKGNPDRTLKTTEFTEKARTFIKDRLRNVKVQFEENTRGNSCVMVASINEGDFTEMKEDVKRLRKRIFGNANKVPKLVWEE